MKTLFHIAGLILVWTAQQASAQFVVPLHIGTTTPVVNESGELLSGNYMTNGALVLVYQALDNVIYPPDTQGHSHTNNPPLAGGASAIGRLTHRLSDTPALFGIAIPGSAQPANGTRLFVRVFNRETIEASSFYGDSEIFVVDGNTPFDVSIPATDIPFDAADDDGDGLNNSWEKVYGTDPNNPDTSNSGLTDYEAVMAGLDPLDPQAVLDLIVTEMGQGRVIVRWVSRPGNFYQLEYTDRIDADTTFTPIGDLIMTDDRFSEFDLAPWLDQYQSRYFRLRLVLPPPD